MEDGLEWIARIRCDDRLEFKNVSHYSRRLTHSEPRRNGLSDDEIGREV